MRCPGRRPARRGSPRPVRRIARSRCHPRSVTWLLVVAVANTRCKVGDDQDAVHAGDVVDDLGDLVGGGVDLDDLAGAEVRDEQSVTSRGRWSRSPAVRCRARTRLVVRPGAVGARSVSVAGAKRWTRPVSPSGWPFGKGSNHVDWWAVCDRRWAGEEAAAAGDGQGRWVADRGSFEVTEFEGPLQPPPPCSSGARRGVLEDYAEITIDKVLSMRPPVGLS